MRSHDLKRAKRSIRREVTSLRDAMPTRDRVRQGARAVDRFLDLDEVRVARTVAAFWSFGSEVPTLPLLQGLHDRGVRVVLPRIDGAELALLPWGPHARMAPTRFGAMEPVEGPTVAPGEVDVVCTPGVAFDAAGHRIGYGGGFYDRLFDAAPRALRVALAFDLQVRIDRLPQGHFDRRVHVIVTPTTVLRTERRG